MRKIVLLIVVLLMMLVGCDTGNRPSSVQTTIIDKPEHYLRISDDIFLIAFDSETKTIDEKGDAYTQKWASTMVTNKYIITSVAVEEYYELEEGEPEYNRIKPRELKLSVYTSENEMEHIKDIDVLKLVEEQIEESIREHRTISTDVSMSLIEIDDRTYVIIELTDPSMSLFDPANKSDVEQIIGVYLDVESEKLYFEEELDLAGKEENYYYGVFNPSRYIEPPEYSLQVARANGSAEGVRITNVVINGYQGNGEEKLFEMYPEALEYFMLEDTRTRMYFYNGDPEEVARLVIEDDLYVNRTLKSDYSKDGQEHVIRSIDDFLKWYDYYGGARDGE